MSITRSTLLNSAAAAVLALPLWAGGAKAQDTQAQGQGADQTQPAQQSGEAEQAGGGQQGQGDPSDTLVATIGDAEIRTSDVMRAIGELPQPLGSQPPEMLAAAAIQQLVVREAILQQARGAGLAQDPEVQALVAEAARAAEENALLQVWLERELQTRVPPRSVNQAYAALQAITTGQLPPLEQLRGRIEQNLRRQAMEEIQRSLLADADITLFGADGQPRAGGGQMGGTGQGADASAQAGGAEQGGDAAAAQGQPQGGAADQGNAGGQQTQDQGTPATDSGRAGDAATSQDQSQGGEGTDQSGGDN